MRTLEVTAVPRISLPTAYWRPTDTFGFDYMVGNGAPDVRVLFSMQNFAPAGDPQTPSNP